MPSTPQLDPSETKLRDTLKAQQKDYDCTPCRIMGSTAFVGLGIYTYASGTKQLKQQESIILKSGSVFGMRSRHGAILATSAVLAGLGMYRLVN
jgi:hypothetical protein